MRHGWFVIPGVQNGDRTLEEQRLGVEKAIAQCMNKTVLDLGCAEGLLSREFAMAGAKFVHGMDALGDHLVVAQDVCCHYHTISFEQVDLNAPPALRRQYDIVLALGVMHKLHEPEIGLRFAAQSSLDLLLVRMTKYTPRFLTSKFKKANSVDVSEFLSGEGFDLESVEPGPRAETVHYYRRRHGLG
jgi:2-polyprenyl-3-methyl-5-hydroxy-6-metoxy-1,4-benzoquinol methylase